MAKEEPAVEGGEEKKKSSLVKIIIMVVASKLGLNRDQQKAKLIIDEAALEMLEKRLTGDSK